MAGCIRLRLKQGLPPRLLRCSENGAALLPNRHLTMRGVLEAWPAAYGYA